MAVQIVYSWRRGSREIEHIGSAHDELELELLKAAARQRLAAGQGELDLGLDTGAAGGPLPITASRMGCLADALEHAYRVLGFDQASGGDEVFTQLVLARIIEPVSKLDSLRVLEEAGLADPSYATLKRRLPAYAKQAWRQKISAACAAHAGLGPASLVLYDVSTLYSGTDEGDGVPRERILQGTPRAADHHRPADRPGRLPADGVGVRLIRGLHRTRGKTTSRAVPPAIFTPVRRRERYLGLMGKQSPLPGLLSERRAVEGVAPGAPVGQQGVHELGEALTVAAFQQVGHLVDDDVLKAGGVFLGQFEVEPDAGRLAVAGAPFGFHPPDAPEGHLTADLLLPPGNERRHGAAQFLALPPLEDLDASCRVGALWHVEQEAAVVDLDMGTARSLDDAEPPAPSPDVMGFSGDHLAFGLAGRVLELLLLLLDPRQALDDSEAHPVLAEVPGSGDTDPAGRRVDADVQVLDVLVDNLDVDPADG